MPETSESTRLCLIKCPIRAASAQRIVIVLRMRDWSALPSDLVGEVTQRLATVSEFVRLRAACKPWRSAVTFAHLPPQFPWLLIPHGLEGDNTGRHLFNPGTGDAQALLLPRGARVFGSGHGWLVLGQDDTDVLTLFNPLTGSSIPLPTFGVQGKQHVWKAFLSSSPSSTSGCAVAVLTGMSQKLQFCRVGAENSSSSSEWTVVNTRPAYLVCDVKYLSDKLYSIDTTGTLTICDADASSIPVFVPPPPCKKGWFVDRCHLVHSSDELLLVVFCTSVPQLFHRSDYYGVYRLEGGDEREPLPRWVRAESIGNRALFVSALGSFSVSANHHHRRRQGCCSRGDCVYVLNYRPSHSKGDIGGNGIGGDIRANVLDLKSGTMDVLHTKHHCMTGIKRGTTWFLPNLC